MPRLSIKAILFGGLASVLTMIGTAIAMSVLLPTVARLTESAAAPPAAPPAPGVATPARAPAADTDVGPSVIAVEMPAPTRVPPTVDFVASLVAIAVGGYVAARYAGRAEVWHGALAAWPTLLLAAVVLLGGTAIGMLRVQDASKYVRDVAGLALAPAAGALGGYLRRRGRGAAPGEDAWS